MCMYVYKGGGCSLKRGSPLKNCLFTFLSLLFRFSLSLSLSSLMSKRVLCKFFANGACLKGDHCEFSHDWNAPANNVCTFYQKGICSYGSRCRYDHVRITRPQFSNGSSSANSLQSVGSNSVTITHPSGTTSGLSITVPNTAPNLPASNKPLSPEEKLVGNQSSGMQNMVDAYDIGEPNSLDPASKPICSFAAIGLCPRGENCPHLHGDLCSSCEKHCLHPFRPREREEHIAVCQKMKKHLDALKRSQEIECSVCLELVLSKPTAAERKFGLLSECDHPFCISCIRNWRSSSPSYGMDVNSTLRACPICRKLSFFVVPSVIWYFSKEDKLEIVDSYKAKLRSIDCKHFNFGDGTCPFGTSCFYKHMVKPGSHMCRVLFDNLYESDYGTRFQELEHYGYEDIDSEGYVDYTDRAEMFRQIMGDGDEDAEDENSFADYMASRYYMADLEASFGSWSLDWD